MPDYFLLEPEVAGTGFESPDNAVESGIGPANALYIFDTWLGDDLIAGHPLFLVTERLRGNLQTYSGTGFSFSPVKIEFSDLFNQFHPNLVMPKFFKLSVTGELWISDAALTPRGDLLVSGSLLSVLKSCQLSHCKVIRRKQKL